MCSKLKIIQNLIYVLKRKKRKKMKSNESGHMVSKEENEK